MLNQPGRAADDAALATIEHPVAFLMNGVTISSEAAALRQDDIRVFANP